jgi:hypothetical protein
MFLPQYKKIRKEKIVFYQNISTTKQPLQICKGCFNSIITIVIILLLIFVLLHYRQYAPLLGKYLLQFVG